MKLLDPQARKRVEIARARLVLDEPFFGSLSLKLKLREDPSAPTAWVDGVNLGYNPEFVKGLSNAELKGLLAHEVMHPALQHHVRRGHRDPRGWNEAADDVINPVLVAAGFTLPEGGRPGVTEDLCAEEVYARNYVPQSKRGGKGSGTGSGAGEAGEGSESSPGDADGEAGDGSSDPGGCGEVRDAPKDAPNSEAEWTVAVQQAANIAKAQGKLPGGLERMIKEILAPKVDWRTALRRFVDTHAKTDYHWTPPSRRHVWRGIYLPSVRGESLPELVVAVDTSGSISASDLAQFAGELNAILEEFDTTAHVIYCDSKVAGYEEVTSQDLPFCPTPKGGGGTAFAPVWDYVREKGITPCCAVYLTDLCCSEYGDAPEYPVMWVKSGSWSHGEVPFGEVVELEPAA